jgi:hypothetical protein
MMIITKANWKNMDDTAFPHFHMHPQKERRKKVAKKEERKRRLLRHTALT